MPYPRNLNGNLNIVKFQKLSYTWHLKITNIIHLAALGYDYVKLFNKFIELKNNTNVKIIFKEKRTKLFPLATQLYLHQHIYVNPRILK